MLNPPKELNDSIIFSLRSSLHSCLLLYQYYPLSSCRLLFIRSPSERLINQFMGLSDIDKGTHNTFFAHFFILK